ncbi:nicotinamide/nicotinic acid mononucleotide adenylyltransferase isoform X1 [Tanacetum coccineum]
MEESNGISGGGGYCLWGICIGRRRMLSWNQSYVSTGMYQLACKSSEFVRWIPGSYLSVLGKAKFVSTLINCVVKNPKLLCDNGLIPSGIIFNLLESGLLVLLLFFSVIYSLELAIWLGYTGWVMGQNRERVDIATNLVYAIAAYLKVMLVCVSDLLESFSTPGAWIPETICRDYGVVCIRREDIEKIIVRDEILTENNSNIEVVDEIVPNRISSTLVRSRNSTPSLLSSAYGYGNPSKKIDIPNGRVGVITGKGGENIKYLQAEELIRDVLPKAKAGRSSVVSRRLLGQQGGVDQF